MHMYIHKHLFISYSKHVVSLQDYVPFPSRYYDKHVVGYLNSALPERHDIHNFAL